MVAFSNDRQHLQVDDDESDKLPNDTFSKKAHDGGRDHRREAGFVRFDVFFDRFHKFLSFSIIQGSVSNLV